MPCNTIKLTGEVKKKQQADLDALRRGLQNGSVKVVIGKAGSLAFSGWTSPLLADLCAYRKLTQEGSFALRQAVARAEAAAGTRLNAQAVGAGVHSHDGGRTWSTH